jgi:hypothetical protein
MKKIALFLSLTAAILLSQSAHADNRYGAFYGPYGNRAYNSWGNNRSYGYNRYVNRGYNRWGGWGRRDSYVNIYYGNGYYGRGWGRPGFGRYRNRQYYSGDLLGGIVLGSLISSSFRSYNEYRDSPKVVYRSRPANRSAGNVIYVGRSAPVTQVGTGSGRRLLRDLQGNCFEIANNEFGDEVRTQLEPENCDY